MTRPALPLPPSANGRRRTRPESIADQDQAELAFRIRRLKDTALRVKWLVALLVAAGAALGIVASRFIAPEYEVRGTVYISPPNRNGGGGGPIREANVINDQSWADLLKSYRVLDTVVVRMRLHVNPASPADAPLFADFTTSDTPTTGGYVLRVAPDGARYELASSRDDSVLARGTLPDSVGRDLGMRWLVPAMAPESEEREIAFSVVRPRDAAIGLRERLITILPEQGQLLTVVLTGSSGPRTAATLNAVLEEFVAVAGELKRAQVGDFAATLRDQLSLAEARLRAAESALETFRSNTITLPSDGGTGAVASDPLVRDYFDKRVTLENVRRDREALEAALASPDRVTIEALMAIPSIAQDQGPIAAALQELVTKESALRAARQLYSDEYATVRDLSAEVRTLRGETIPRLAQAKLQELRASERDLDKAVASFSGELRRIPQRAIEETRLRREFAIADQFYTSLLTRWNEVRLAAQGSSADVRVLDRADVPAFPSSNTAPRIALLGLVGGFGLAFAAVFLINARDHRLRYPEEAQNELGVEIIGYIPTMPRDTRRDRDALAAAQAIEAFRSLRLRLEHDCADQRTPTILLTSVGAGEGKSLISSNLANSFADAGRRTLLIDGDLRRGTQHQAFGVDLSPGLTEVLAGVATLDEALRPIPGQNLTVLPAGKRHRRVPELLDRDRVEAIFAELRQRYEAIIVDSAPLGAGVDSYAMGAAAGHVVLILRQSVTDRRMAAAKLEVLDRLPIHLTGAVMNAVPAAGAGTAYYSYYSYLPEYALLEGDAPKPMLPRNRKG